MPHYGNDAWSWLSSSESPAPTVNPNPSLCPPRGAHSRSASNIDPCFVKGADGSARPGGAGRGCAAEASAGRRGAGVPRSGAVLEAPALVAGLDDVAVMREAIEQRGGHLRVGRDRRQRPSPLQNLTVEVTYARQA